jgi:hypothetical protein
MTLAKTKRKDYVRTNSVVSGPSMELLRIIIQYGYESTWSPYMRVYRVESTSGIKTSNSPCEMFLVLGLEGMVRRHSQGVVGA